MYMASRTSRPKAFHTLGLIRRRLIPTDNLRLDHSKIGRGVGMNAEVPHITVDALLSQHFCKCIFAGSEGGLWSELNPAFAQLFSGGGDRVLFLADLPIHRG